MQGVNVFFCKSHPNSRRATGIMPTLYLKPFNPNLNVISETSESSPAINIYFDFSMLRHEASINSSGVFLIRESVTHTTA